MTAATYPTVHRTATLLMMAVISTGVTVASMLGASTANASTVAHHHSRTDLALCLELAHATPGSPAAFRLAEEAATQGGCRG
jgi:hypothetical protein